MHEERAMKQSTTTYVAMDTHKKTISLAIAEGGRRGETRFIGEIPNRPEAVAKMADRLARKHGKLAFCYEAGPCGYGLYRQLTLLGHECVVVAPSLIPTRPGDRVKTDRRDAVTQASLFRSGELTPVWIPDEAHEAMRDLCRARQAAVEALRRARQQVSGFLLRHGRIYADGKHWTRKHRFWLATQRFEHPARQIAFEELVQAMDETKARRDRLSEQMQELVPSWSLAKVVAAIQALRGIAVIAAITLVAEIGDFKRFANPRQLMAYLGLTPTERSSGAKTARGAITKAGNSRARRMLVESAWTYRLPARMGVEILKRNEALSQAIKEIAWKAQARLCSRYRRLAKAGKPTNVVCVAIARELAAFVWAIATNGAVAMSA
jgi:transposase